MSTIGEQLKHARETRHLTIQQVVQATRIRDYYLEAMEADDFSSMPSPAQARGFFRSYAEFLGLDADGLVDLQRNQTDVPAEFGLPTGPAFPPNQPAQQEKPPEPEPPALPEPPIVPDEPEPLATPIEVETAEPHEPLPPAISQLIFFEIGHELRQRRELLSLTLEEIERHTKVRKHYLEEIEAGNYDELPSPVQARGMLSNYASFLDVDAESILLRFADALQARRIERQPATGSKSNLSRPRLVMPAWLGRFISPDLLFGGGMILLLFGLTLWGAVRIFSGSSAKTVDTQGPSISDVLLATPSPAASQELAPAAQALPTSVSVVTPTDTEVLVTNQTGTPQSQSGGISSGVQVTLSILERTFIRVTVDGQIKLDSRVAPGAALPFQGNDRIEVLTGSGSAIQVLFNQQNLGLMGDFGEVVDRIYTVSGVQTPTSTFTPTLSPTPRFLKTPTPTPTITPTRTPTLTRTPTVQK